MFPFQEQSCVTAFPSVDITPLPQYYAVIRLPVILDALTLLSLGNILSLCVEITGPPKFIYHINVMHAEVLDPGATTYSC